MSDSYPGPYRSEFLRKADETSSPLDSSFGNPSVPSKLPQTQIMPSMPRQERLSEKLPPIFGATRLGQRLIAFEAAQAHMRQQELVEAQAQLTLMGNQINTMMGLDEKDRGLAEITFANEWEQRRPGMGTLFRNMSESKLAYAADLQEITQLHPVLRAAMASGGLDKVLEEYNGNADIRTFVDGVVTSNQRDQTIERAINAARYLQKNHAQEFSDTIGKDGIIQSGELVGLNRLLPENLKLKAHDFQLLDSDPATQQLLGFEPSARALAREEVYAKLFKEAQIKEQFEDKKPLNILTPDGKIRISYDEGRTIVMNGRTVPVPEGSQIFTSRAQGAVEDLTPGIVPGKKEKIAAGAEARESSERIAQLTTSLARIAASEPGATGIVGAVADRVTGVIGQFSPGTASALSEWATGMNPEELAGLQTQIATIAPQTIRTFTAEESGRITDKELGISTQASKAASKTASKDQIMGALKAIIIMDLANRDRQLITAGFDPKYDITTEEGQIEASSDFIYKYGLDPKSAGYLIRTLVRQHDMLKESGALKKKKEPNAPE